ncbi:MAG: hypothetical protein V4706_14690 [Pseudomonadota bacterium]
MKNDTTFIVGLAALAAFLYLRRPAAAAIPTPLDTPKPMQTLKVGESLYQPSKTDTAATLPAGFYGGAAGYYA